MMVPAVMYALWGTSKQAAVGPQSIPALLIGSAVTGKLNDVFSATMGYLSFGPIEKIVCFL
jgi:hypothetical protein